jgi:hypothetical protein
MKNMTRYLATVLLMVTVIVVGLSNCTKTDQLLDLTTPPPTLNTDTLYSDKGTATLRPTGGGAWDGTIEAAWNNAPKLTIHAVVPDLGNGTFTGYVGNATEITMRSLYDASNIYYLVEFDAAQKNVKSAQWYFNPSTKLWAQESGAPTMNPDGTFRPPFGQDQFVIMFNIANSTPAFLTLSCYAACHVNSSYGGATTPPGGVMYTNGPTERLDCWRARMLQVVNVNQANDCFIDDGASVGLGSSGTLNKNEVHGDWQVNNGSASSVPPQFQSAQAADGGFTNKQTLTITGTTTKEGVPIWVIPGGNYNNSAIMLSDTLPSGAAVKVIAVDANGVLTLSNSTTIDPALGSDYKQVGSGNGPKCIPGSIVGAYTGSRGDVIANAFYTGTGWRLLLMRALKTTDTANDVDFSSLSDQPFGIGAMFNGADNQHAIVAGLTLHFQK